VVGASPAIRFRDTRLGQGAAMALPIWAGFFQLLVKDDSYSNYTNVPFKPMNDQ